MFKIDWMTILFRSCCFNLKSAFLQWILFLYKDLYMYIYGSGDVLLSIVFITWHRSNIQQLVNFQVKTEVLIITSVIPNFLIYTYI